MKIPRIPLAREGYPFIFFFGFVFLISGLLQFKNATIITLLLTAFTTYFFRDPERVSINDPEDLLSPADGKIILIEEIYDDRFVKANVTKLSIFMNIFDVHVNRIPLAGTVENIISQPGRFYSADKDKATLHNEYCSLIIRTPDNIKYGVVQVAGLIARRIVCRVQKNDTVYTGQRFGLIRFGSRVDLYLPKSLLLTVKKGQRVLAGKTVLAKIKQHTTD